MKRLGFIIPICCAAFVLVASGSLAAPETPSPQREPAAWIEVSEPLTLPEADEALALPKGGQPIALSTGITCQFTCEDGSGFGLDPCPDSTLGECCAYAEPACAGHGGLASGICTNGRLGLPCQGI